MGTEHYTLITGASEGFGKALALECASRNMNLILVALPGTGLGNLARLIEREFDVKAVFFEYDLTRKDTHVQLFSKMEELGLRANILINNAGIGGTHFFEEKSIEFYCRQIELNVTAPTLLSYLFISQVPAGYEAHILNVSSLASFFYLPRKQVYGGTKSYLLAFSKSLRKELKHKKIYVSTICPGGMNTVPVQMMINTSGDQFSRWSAMDPEDVAHIAIDKMLQHKELIIPGNWNRLFLALDRILPDFIKVMLTTRAMKKLKPVAMGVPVAAAQSRPAA
ncbi:MAG TPA: SDR family NAD(P)-dependent oxidoreductase [Chitinophagaceae bacterium]|nr:SDR family NAD(P)-dependent oxidoreductase [Chitinophagaceae bacterium]